MLKLFDVVYSYIYFFFLFQLDLKCDGAQAHFLSIIMLDMQTNLL